MSTNLSPDHCEELVKQSSSTIHILTKFNKYLNYLLSNTITTNITKQKKMISIEFGNGTSGMPHLYQIFVNTKSMISHINHPEDDHFREPLIIESNTQDAITNINKKFTKILNHETPYSITFCIGPEIIKNHVFKESS